MDTILLKGLEVFAYHGVNPEEKQDGQPFVFDVEAAVDLKRAALSDRLEDTVSYAAMAKVMERAVTAEKFDLIERVAGAAAKAVLEAFPPVERLTVTVKKPKAPMKRVFEYMAVRLTFCREDFAAPRQETEEQEKQKQPALQDLDLKQAYVALGSNLGDPVDNLRRAAWALTLLPRTHVKKVSRVYKTKPVGFAGQDDFYNAAVKVSTALTPQALLGGLLGIEAAMGRVRGRKNGPRVIDLDLLAFEGAELDTPELELPHPRMLERGFVLAPLCDISLDPLYRRALKEVGREGVEVIHDAIVV